MKPLLALLLLCLVPVAGLAQGWSGHGLSDAQTERVVSSLRGGFRVCAEVAEIYQPDCMKYATRKAEGRIGNVPAYWEAQVSLKRLSRRLDAIVRDHADPDARSLRHGGYRLVAVRRSVLPALRMVATDMFAEAQADLRTGSSEEVIFFAPIADMLANNRPWP